jgi:hypothetical protein
MFVPSADQNRTKLLPLWIRIFCWIFLVAGAFVPLLLLIGPFYPAPMHFSLFGWSHDGSPYDVMSLLILAYLAASGAAGYGLLWGRPWGWDAGIVVGTIGLVVALASLVNARQPDGSIYIALEPVLQVPYLYTLWRIRHGWYAGEAPNQAPAPAAGGVAPTYDTVQPLPVLSRYFIATLVGAVVLMLYYIVMSGALNLLGSIVFSAGLTLVFLLPMRLLIPALAPWLSRQDQGRIALGFLLFVVTVFTFALPAQQATQGRLTFWTFWALYTWVTWYPMFRPNLLPRAIAEAMEQTAR